MYFLKSCLLCLGLFIVTFFFALPALMLPFVNLLPYLNGFSFLERLPFALIIFILGYYVSLLGAKPKNREASVNMFKSNMARSLIAFSFVIAMGAFCSANSLGALIKVMPNQPYAEQMEVVNAKTRGSKMRSVDLNLKSKADSRIYYLTLSEQLFNYPKFNIGDKLILKGKQNWFGVYVEEFHRV